MDTCYNCKNWEEKYDRLSRRFDRLSDSYRDLDKKYDKAYDDLNSANHKIRTELEPRIEREHRSYDSYVTNGGGDECFQNGMNGHCGYECPMFGDKPECYENVTTEEQILDIYENQVTTGYVLDLIKKFGLEEKVKEIDRNIIRNNIEQFKEKIKKLEDELIKIV